MSWDAIIGKTTDPNYAKPAESAAFVAIGKPSEVKEKLRASVSSIKWSSISEGHAYIGRLSVEFSLSGKDSPNAIGQGTVQLRESDQVETIGLSARGDGDPVAVVVAICKANQWSAADSQTGDWIDLNASSQESWKQFSEFKENVTRNLPGEDRSTSGSVGINLLISCAVFAFLALVVRLFLK